MTSPRIAIVGAGAAGICAAARLVAAGHRDVVLLEKGERIGGTWRDNAYPGAACDVPSHLYSFSFAPNARWSRRYSPQREILSYLERVAEEHDVLRRVRFGEEVVRARFERDRWRISTAGGEAIDADVLVTACGQLHRPFVPEIAGAESFRGRAFHSARWDRAFPLDGARVAVIGSAASAVQIVPAIAPRVAHLSVFQRTPNWIVPREDHAYGEGVQRAFEALPLARTLHRLSIYLAYEKNLLAFLGFPPIAWWSERLARRHLEAQVGDPALRRALTPDYPVGCKRVLSSDDYYPALQRPNVSLVTAGIERIVPEGIVTNDGARVDVDAIVWATGFETTRFLAPMEIEGPTGTLERAWANGAEAYLGTMVAGFPNLFLLYGPNTNLGHNSILFMIECQTRFLVSAVSAMAREGLASIDVRPEAMARFNATLRRDLARTVWAGSCGSWYKDERGRITNNWSGSTIAFALRTLRPRFSELIVR